MTTPHPRRAAEAAHDPHVLGQRRRRAGVRALWRRPRDPWRRASRSTAPTASARVMGSASSGAILLLVIGILMTAGEFRHGTATSTFLISPDRRRVIGAKLVAAALVGVVVALASVALTLAVALPWLAAEDVATSSYTSEAVAALLGSVGATVLGAVVGVGSAPSCPQPDRRDHDRPGLDAGRRGHPGRLRARGRQVAARRCRERAGRRGDAERRDAADVGGGGRAGRLRPGLRRGRRGDPGRRDIA